MNAAELALRLTQGGLSLAFDTNALYADRRLIKLCNQVARWNDYLATASLSPVRLIICTVAHAEKCFDLKQKYRDTFRLDVIVRGLESKGMEIAAFDSEHAAGTANWLGSRYESSEAWYKAKRQRYLQALGLANHPAAAQAPGSGKECSATIDWLIIGHALAESCLLVSDDTGMEFQGLIDQVSLGTLEAALTKILEGKQ